MYEQNSIRVAAGGMALAMGMSISLPLQAAEFYAGVRAGPATANLNAAALNESLAAIQDSSVQAEFDDESLAATLFGGIQLGKAVAAETYVSFLGDYDLTLNGEIRTADSLQDVRQAVQEFGAPGGYALGIGLRITPRLYDGSPAVLVLRPGIYWSHAELKVRDPLGQYAVKDDHRFASFGVGIAYPFQQWLIEAGADFRPAADAGTTQFSVGGSYRFRSP